MAVKKFSTFFLIIVLQLASGLYQNEATVPVDVDHSLKSTVRAKPVGNSIRGKAYSIDVVRHLEGEEKDAHKRDTPPTFHVLLATLIVNVVALVSILSLIPVLLEKKWSCFKSLFWVASNQLHATEAAKHYASTGKGPLVKNLDKHAKEQQPATHRCDIIVPSLICGVIQASILFLIIPEAIHFIQRSTSSAIGESDLLPGTISRFGVSVMAGFMLPLVLGAFFPSSSEHLRYEYVSSSGLPTKKIHKVDPPHNVIDEEEKSDEGEDDANDSEIKGGASFESKATNIINDSGTEEDSDGKINEQENDIIISLATTIFFGDAIHGLFDGFFIGVSFMTCSTAIAVLMTLITIYKETSQEMIDYFILTKCAGISVPRALLLNFTSGLAVIVGALMMVGIGPGDLGIGVFLAFAAGVHLHISASECLPRIYSIVTCSKDKFFSIFFFFLGALPIGLTLLKDEKCNA